MPTIRMKTTSAGPAGCRDAGKPYGVDAGEGWGLVDAGSAVWVGAPPPRTGAPIETAVMPQRETAVSPRGRKGRR